MKNSLLTVIVSLAATSVAEAQVSAILYTGRFPFVSLGVANERPGGAISQLSPYDFCYSIPVPGGFPALPLMTAANMHSYLGDADLDGDYLKLDGWKASYFSNIGIDGLFVKDADRSDVSFDKIFWTPRLGGVATMEVLVGGGTPVTLAEGDWVRFQPNGNLEFFVTQAQLQVAVGAQTGTFNIGMSAMVQSAAGDLYYTPADDGHWVNGSQGGSEFAQDGAILKIDAANITYDAFGNVAAFAPDSARLLINENAGGPGGSLTVRQMVDNSTSFDRFGLSLLTTGTYGKTCGLGFDPNGGTWTPLFPDATGAFVPEPNFVFCSNAGSYGGTIWTTANQGEVAVINGVLCGSTTNGVPADGSWLGVELNTTNFQPTMLGMTLIDVPQQPLIADINDFGRVVDNVTQPTLEFDFIGTPGEIVVAFADLGPAPPSPIVPSIDTSLVPLGFDPGTWPDLFLVGGPVSIGFGLTDLFGYTTVAVGNPNTGAFADATLMIQGVALSPGGFKLSSPVLLQLQ